jgi:hypothetical protein
MAEFTEDLGPRTKRSRLKVDLGRSDLAEFTEDLGRRTKRSRKSESTFHFSG